MLSKIELIEKLKTHGFPLPATTISFYDRIDLIPSIHFYGKGKMSQYSERVEDMIIDIQMMQSEGMLLRLVKKIIHERYYTEFIKRDLHAISELYNFDYLLITTYLESVNMSVEDLLPNDNPKVLDEQAMFKAYLLKNFDNLLIDNDLN